MTAANEILCADRVRRLTGGCRVWLGSEATGRKMTENAGLEIEERRVPGDDHS